MANISTPLQHCNIIESCVPLQSTSGTNLKPKWMTRRVRNRIREKEDAWIRYRQRRSRARYATYCRKRNYATSAVKEAKYNFEKKLSDESKGKLFADDAKIYQRIKNADDGVDLQQDLDKLKEWSRKWLLQFNEEKCKVMHIGRNNPGYEYTLGPSLLEETVEEKDLGVIITNDLKLSRQMSKAAASANSICWDS
ncbi:hypothetical protein Pcinc_019464 [Petrolisthes cinctipes]|uniref:Reverse transcriptase domain-containing protein n=1 Tax=Petrolisthes cinctipes TaxID=88211 RepID=A0AAE1FL49_PETCI|nr:hypothetical protein Pcinc_019464 [Petrolisthes cinctipes]